jgi:hypothetical protein
MSPSVCVSAALALALSAFPPIADLLVPAEAPARACVLTFTSPLGPGSVQIDIAGCAGGNFITAISLDRGTFPTGWFYGVDIAPPLLLAETTPLWANVPFTGLLAAGSFTFGPILGVPSGLQIYAVTVTFTPPFYADSSAPVTYVIP